MSSSGLSPGRIAAVYAALTAAWVFLVHEVLGSLDLIADVLFVVITALALLGLTRLLVRRAREDREAAIAEARSRDSAARILRVTAAAGQALLRASDEQDLYESLCRRVVEDPRFTLAWVGSVDPEPSRSITVRASAGDQSAYVQGLVVTWDDAPTGRGPTGTAIREGRTQVANEIATDPRLAPWRERLLTNGFLASIALPIVHEGRRIAALSVYAREAGVFTETAVAELERLAVDVAFAVSGLDARRERDEAIARQSVAATRLELLHDIDRSILQVRRMEAIAPDVVGRLRVMTGATRAGIVAIDDRRRAPVIVASADVDPSSATPAGRPVVGTMEILEGLRGPTTGDLADLAQAFPDLAVQAGRGMCRGALLPLLHEGRIHGALSLLSRDPAFPDDEVLAMAGEVADQLAIAARGEQLLDDLTDREARLRAILDGSPNPILTVDAAGLVRFASPATASVFGVDPEAIVGRPVDELVPDAGREGHAELLGRWFTAPADTGAHPLDIQGRRADGSQVPLQVLLAPHATPDGPQAIMTVVDLSDRAAMEARLRQAERLEILGQFAGVLAHDVRNYFSAIAWSAELLGNDIPADSPLVEDVRIIQLAVRDGVAMTQSVLEFARPGRESGGSVRIAAHLDQVSGVMRRMLPDGVRLDVVCPDDLPPVSLSAAALTQVLLNLATNAADAMPGGGTFRIEALETEVAAGERGASALPVGRYVRLLVSDTGTGMDETTARRAFEPFFTTKVDATTAAGTGLGLASVFLIVNRAGGRITVDSRPGEGTRFTIDLLVPEA